MERTALPELKTYGIVKKKARAQVEIDKTTFWWDSYKHQEKARQRATRHSEAQYELEQRAVDQQNWLKKHNKTCPRAFSRKQLKTLNAWFRTIDTDGSGEISVDELEEPLLSIGAANCFEEVRQIVNEIDTDGSGTLNFDEFVAILTPTERLKPHAAARRKGRTAFLQLQDQMQEKQDQHLSVNTRLAVQRRQFLVDSIFSSIEDKQAKNSKHLTRRPALLNLHREEKAERRRRKQEQMRFNDLQSVIKRNNKTLQKTFLSSSERELVEKSANDVLRSIEGEEPKPTPEASSIHMIDVQRERRRRLQSKARDRALSVHSESATHLARRSNDQEDQPRAMMDFSSHVTKKSTKFPLVDRFPKISSWKYSID